MTAVCPRCLRAHASPDCSPPDPEEGRTGINGHPPPYPPDMFDSAGAYVPPEQRRAGVTVDPQAVQDWATRMIDTLTEKPKLGVKARKLARFDLLPPDVLWEVAEILGWGAANRGDTERNWENGLVSSEPIGGALRHLAQWMAGEENDEETGKSHLSHAICNLMFARGLQLRGQLIDARGAALGPLRTEVVDPAPTA